MTREVILYIKRNCLDDGPGIRTTVFFKGCPLSCVWCHNPESKKASPELSYSARKCIGCGGCAAACLRSAIGPGVTGFVDREKCNLCFKCVDVCPAGALERLGRTAGIDEIMDTIKRDVPFFKSSGGGVTLSGGEPTLYMDFAAELFAECKKTGVSTLIETCGHFDFEKFTSALLPNLDTVYVDIKLISNDEHLRHCGMGNEKILKNVEKLAALSARGEVEVLPRVPLVPGVTDTDNNLGGIAAFLKGCGFKRVALLPYNPTWLEKPEMTGAEAAFTASGWMSVEEVERCRSHFSGFEMPRR